MIAKEERDKAIKQKHAQNIPVIELAANFNISRQAVYAILKKEIDRYEIKKKRDQRIVNMFTAGKTMAEIAAAVNLTRQAVQQILKKEEIEVSKGGSALRSQINKSQRDKEQKKQEMQKCHAKWGCYPHDLCSLRTMSTDVKKTPIARYIQHRSNVLRDGIEWELSLWDWWTLWSASGRYHQRGRGKNKYYMARKNPTVGYTVENVIIQKN
jgi:predicted DNA-binding protein YlxM (UPF0122 family)